MFKNHIKIITDTYHKGILYIPYPVFD